MDDKEIFRTEWLAFEKELGFRPLLHGPTYHDLVLQNTEIGLAVMTKYRPQSIDSKVATHEDTSASKTRLKISTPPKLKADQPVVLYIHGGGCCLGSANEDDNFVHRYATDSGLVFVSVEYRLAPQHPYPDGLNDCVEAAEWCINNSSSLGGKPRKVIVMGVSAGASLALATGLKLLKAGKKGELDGVVAIQPFTLHPDAVPEEYAKQYTSYDEHSQHSIDTKQAMKTFFDCHGASPANRYIFPALNPRLRDLPCVYLSACEVDPLRDDARILKKLLDKYGVPNEYDELSGLPHFFFAYPSRHLDTIRDDYFAKTAAGIAFILESSIQSPLPLC